MKNFFLKSIFLLILIKILSVEAYAQIAPTTAPICWQPGTVYSTQSGKCQYPSNPSSTPAWHPGPSDYSDWFDVTDQSKFPNGTPAAYGDGVHDDTAAIQYAFNQISNGNAYALAYSTVYFPPGTYKISSTLSITTANGVNVIGSGSSTIILWAGAYGGTMYKSEGVTQSRYLGITWDGNNTAAVGIDHRSTTNYESRIRHEQETFKNFTGTSNCTTAAPCSAVRIGYNQVQATAETFFLNDIFQNNTIGLILYTADDFDEKLLKTVFINNGTGIYSRGGIYTIGETNFYQNTIDINSPGYQMRVRSVTSQGSGQFISQTSFSPQNIQNCRVADWGSISQWTFENAFPSQTEPTYGTSIFTWLVGQGYVVINSATPYYGYVPATLNFSSSTIVNNVETQFCGEDTQSCSASTIILGLLQQTQQSAAGGAINLVNTDTASIFDNDFTNANPSASSPVQPINGSPVITSYNNTWNGSANSPIILLQGNQLITGYFTKIINIPGTTALNNLPANFVDSTFNTPSMVFNVNTYHGATSPTVPPLAVIKVNSSVQAGTALSFSASSSTDSSSTINTWSWNFGDGSSSTLAAPSHTYATAGSYKVTLFVTDALGQSSPTAGTTITATSSPVTSPTLTTTSNTCPSDWTCAIQAAINAAANSNNGNASMAVGAGPAAYFPATGGEPISSTINLVNGNNMTIMGAGEYAGPTTYNTATFNGSAGLNIIDPVNVKISHISFSFASPLTDISQSSSSAIATSNIVYDGLYANSTSLSLSNLSPQSSVHIIDFDLGNITATGSYQADIFIDAFQGDVTISGAGTQTPGYFNIDYMDSGGASTIDATVNDNQSLTIGYLYDENFGSLVDLNGTPAESGSPGHVTVSGTWEAGGTPQIVSNGYTGTFTQLDTYLYDSGGIFEITANTGATSFLFLNNAFGNSNPPTFALNSTSSFMMLQNIGGGYTLLADTSLSPTMAQATSALNDLRALANNNLSQTGYNQG